MGLLGNRCFYLVSHLANPHDVIYRSFHVFAVRAPSFSSGELIAGPAYECIFCHKYSLVYAKQVLYQGTIFLASFFTNYFVPIF